MGRFKVMGDRIERAGVLLEEFDTLAEAKSWLERYIRSNMGGYHTIEVVEFLKDRVNVFCSITSEDNTLAFNSSQR